jgi:hypothetical protein
VRARSITHVRAVTTPAECAPPSLNRLVPGTVVPGGRVRAIGKNLARVTAMEVGKQSVPVSRTSATRVTFMAPLRRGRHTVTATAKDKRSNELPLRIRREGPTSVRPRALRVQQGTAQGR